MSQGNVEIAQRIYQILAEQGVNEQAFLAMIDAGLAEPDAELDFRTAYPDGEVWRFDGIGKFFDSQPWGRSIRFEAESFKAVGDHRVLVFVRVHGVGGASGVAVEGRFAHLGTFRGSRLVRTEVYTDRSKALEAAGLREWDSGPGG
jgi:ketosteroid isomerase-like protein